MKNTDKLNRHIFIKDNLEVLRAFDDESVDLIYLDPPFNSNKNYGAPIGSEAAGAHFKDIWTYSDTDDAWWGLLADKEPGLYEIIHAVGCINGEKDKSYLIAMAMRLLELKRVLKDTGSIYLHCDQTMSHSLKLVMDAIFDKKNFKNEIIWNKGFRGTPRKKRYQQAHDTLFFYIKGKYKWNNIYQEYKDLNMKRYNKVDSKGKKYALIKRKRTNGDIYYGKCYPKGKQQNDVIDIPLLPSTSKERTGYPTQKPRGLLEKIIKASSNEGDLVLDPFCGCATTCIAAEKLNRKWIGIDLEKPAGYLVKRRLKKELGASFSFLKTIQVRNTLPIKKAPKPSKNIKHILYGQQKGYCNGCKVHFEFRMFHLDHVVAKARGGQDTDTNLQLLCGHCNSVKGDRGMEYLRARLKEQGVNKFEIIKDEDIE